MHLLNLNTRRKLGRAMVRLGCPLHPSRQHHPYLSHLLERLEVIFPPWRNPPWAWSREGVPYVPQCFPS